jgi:3'(2'), 5'-bisphosphate nucleotidase
MSHNHKVKLDDVITIAKEAGDIAMQFYNKEYSVKEKQDRSPVTEADMAVHHFLVDTLSQFGYPILSEESADQFHTCDSAFTWIVDPIDGTRDFIQRTGEFAIMIGLIDQTKRSVLGVVCAPALNELYFAEKSSGAYKCHPELVSGSYQKITVSNKDLTGGKIFVSRNHLGEWEQEIAEKYDMEKVTMGSAGLKICKVAAGEAELYINSSDKGSVWDTCAADVILHEAGGNMTDMLYERILYDCKKAQLKNGFIVFGGVRLDKM